MSEIDFATTPAKMSTSVTELVLVRSDAMSIYGKVLGADATATTYLIECPPDANTDECGRGTQTLTLGPWAEKTLAAGAEATGTMDILSTGRAEGRDWYYSLHCTMSRSVAQRCTVTNRPAASTTLPPTTFSGQTGLMEIYGPTFEYGKVVLTDGLELLKSDYPTVTTTENSEKTASDAKEKSASTSSTSDASGSNGAKNNLSCSLAAVCVGLLAVLAL